MAEQRAGTAKTTATGAKRPARQGPSYLCEVRARTTPVDQSCECAQFCDVECSGGPMTVRRSKRQATPGDAPVRMVGDS
jgi:hypothetical protein